MVSTRREIDVRLEILEHRFEGLLAMRENMEKILEDGRKERVEASQQIVELTALMRHTLRTTSGSLNDSDDDASIHTKHPRKCEERWRKLEIPVFEGTDTYGWFNGVERYFDLKKIGENEDLQAAMVAMEGKALVRYQWWEFLTQNPTWEDFRVVILRRTYNSTKKVTWAPNSRSQNQVASSIGESKLSKAATSFKSILKVMRDEGRVFLLEYQILKAGTGSVISPPSWLEEVLSEFEEVFQEPKGVPSSRRQKHVIVLKEGVNIPNIKPYRYPHYQKNETERLVDDMLKSGVIGPNASPYSSPIILVRKRWRMTFLCRL
ncbi:hypothetical protein KIW84_046056 [Lathyrus oleraceus]|uniref:Uncharacterized protein n=1 Tax=Pisum sativum TaxID=3888 RepID=A0A9D4XLS6_PEA|nr:hypothetical protein KIW84_046056 [Pisum sativum]